MISQLDNCEGDLEDFNATGNTLQNLLSQYNSKDKSVPRRVSHLNAEYRKIHYRLADRLADVQQVTEQAQEFTIIIKDFNTWINIVKEELEAKLSSPVVRDVILLKQRIDEIEVGIVIALLLVLLNRVSVCCIASYR